MEEQRNETWTLYLARAHHTWVDETTSVYARDEAHARHQLQAWIKERSSLLIEFQAYPSGFTISQTSLPGTITVPVDREGNDDVQQ